MDIVHTVQGIAEEAFRFIVFGVGLGYIARKIVADFLIQKGRKLINKTEFRQVVYGHYLDQALGKGHSPASPYDCNQGRCKAHGMVTASPNSALLA